MLLRRFTEQGRNVSDKQSPSYAPAKVAEQPEAKKAKASGRTLAEAMERLFAVNRIKVVTEGPPSRRIGLPASLLIRLRCCGRAQGRGAIVARNCTTFYCEAHL